jgi:hypothetical protein
LPDQPWQKHTPCPGADEEPTGDRACDLHPFPS